MFYDPRFTQNIVDSIFFNVYNTFPTKRLTLSLGYYKENLRWINILQKMECKIDFTVF